MKTAVSIRINLYLKKGPLDVLGWMLGVQQRSAITHTGFEVTILDEDGVFQTVYWGTGAKWHWLKGPVWGQKPIAEYNKDRAYYQLEFVEPLGHEQLQALMAAIAAFDGQRYGLEKVLLLALAGNTKAEFICQLGKINAETKSPFCSDGVVAACWKVGIFICQWLCRKESSVCTPHDLYLEGLRGKLLRITRGVGVEL